MVRLLGIVVLVTACSSEKGLHYRNDKHFGQPPGEAVPGDENSDGSEGLPGVSSPTPSEEEVAAPRGGRQQPSNSPSTENEGDNTEPSEGTGPQPVDPNTLIANVVYQGVIDKASVRKLTNGNGIGGEVPARLNSIEDFILGYLPSNPQGNTIQVLVCLENRRIAAFKIILVLWGHKNVPEFLFVLKALTLILMMVVRIALMV